MRSACSAEQLVARHRQSERARPAHQARQQPGAAAVGNQADPGEGLDETGAAGGDHEVAAEREVGAGAGGDAVDGGDHRHRQVGNAVGQWPVLAFDHGAHIGRTVGASVHVGVGQVLAGAEAPPRPVTSSALTPAAAAASSSAARSSPCMAAVKLLSCAGRFRVRMRTAPSSATRTRGSDSRVSGALCAAPARGSVIRSPAVEFGDRPVGKLSLLD
jgi:hypothetical protein